MVYNYPNPPPGICQEKVFDSISSPLRSQSHKTYLEDLGGFLAEASSGSTFSVEATVSKGLMRMFNCWRPVTSPIPLAL